MHRKNSGRPRPWARTTMVAVTAMVGALVGASAAPAQAAEAFTVTTVTDASVLAQAFAGTNSTISNATLLGDAGQAATFRGGMGPVGIYGGIALSSGGAANMAVAGSSTSEDTTAAGDANLSALIGGEATNDAAVLEFDLVPAGSTLSFDYVYATNESGSTFHDPFGLFVNGVNCARFPGTGHIVTSVNLQKAENSAYRINGGQARGLNMGRLSTVLTCEVAVLPGELNHIKIAVADSRDHIVNSAVFIADRSEQTSISYTGATTATVGDGAVEVSADLTDTAGEALAGQDVTFTLGTQTVVATTDDLGHAAASIALAQPVGMVTVEAAVAGSLLYRPSSDQKQFEITKMATGTELSVSPSPSAWGEAIALTATVTGPGDTTPTGVVQFFNDGVSVGSATLEAGTAALQVSDLAVGSYALTATYEGTDDFASSTVEASHSVEKAATTTTLSSSPDAPVTGSPVTLTATVDGAPDAVPTGSVTFTDGEAVLGTVALDVDGVAVLQLDSLDAGPHAVTATYDGDDNNFAGSASAASDLSVGKVSATVTLAQSAATTPLGTSFDLTATVDSSSGATGVVEFYAGTTRLGSAPLVDGVATFTVAELHAGDYSLTAVYGGDVRTSSATSDAIRHSVAKAATTTTLTFSPTTPGLAGDPVTLTAVVKPSAATGSVTFKRGTTVLGSAALTGGTARLVVKTLPAGTNLVVASYGGSVDYTGSSSAGSSIVVRSPAWSSAQVEVAPGTRQAWSTRTTTGTFGGTQAVEASAGALASYAFSGTALTYWYSTGPRGGVAHLFVDGTFVRSVNMYSSVAKVRQSVRLSGLKTGSHSLAIGLALHDSTTLAVREVTVDAFSAATTCGTGCDVTPTLGMRWAKGVNPIASGGDYRFSRAAGATTTVKFTGTGVSVSRIIGPQQGKFQVFLDGVSRGVVNGYAAKNAMTASATTITGLTRGSHTLVIKVLGQAGSTSVPTSINVCLDRVGVLQ